MYEKPAPIPPQGENRLALNVARNDPYARSIGEVDDEGYVLIEIINFTIVDPDAALIFISPTLMVDEQPVACGGLFYKFCNLAASTSYSNCPVRIGALIRYNGFAELGYEIWIDDEEVRSGPLDFEGTDATIPEFNYYLDREFTQIVIYILDEDNISRQECMYTIRRMSSQISSGSCNIGTPDIAVTFD